MAVVETLSGIRTEVQDPYLKEASNWGYQDLQRHQKELVDRVVAVNELTRPSEDTVAVHEDQVDERLVKLFQSLFNSLPNEATRAKLMEELSKNK